MTESSIKVKNSGRYRCDVIRAEVNVIKFVDSFSSGDNIFIVTEFCNGGDLEEYCKKQGKLP